MVCKNICDRIKVQSNGRESEYSEGKKFCRRCHCYFITSKVFCECCGMQLRTKTHGRKYKKRQLLRQRQRINSLKYGKLNREWLNTMRRIRYQSKRELLTLIR